MGQVMAAPEPSHVVITCPRCPRAEGILFSHAYTAYHCIANFGTNAPGLALRPKPQPCPSVPPKAEGFFHAARRGLFHKQRGTAHIILWIGIQRYSTATSIVGRGYLIGVAAQLIGLRTPGRKRDCSSPRPWCRPPSVPGLSAKTTLNALT
jgi:hypothetical protein